MNASNAREWFWANAKALDIIAKDPKTSLPVPELDLLDWLLLDAEQELAQKLHRQRAATATIKFHKIKKD